MITMSELLVFIWLAQVFTGRSRDVLGGEVYQPEWYRLSRELERDGDNEIVSHELISYSLRCIL